MMLRNMAIALSVAGAVGLAASSADALTLAELTAPGAAPIVQGDKVYSNFVYASAALPAQNVTVTLAPNAQFGLRFSASWNTDVDANLDSVIQYDVTVTDSGSSIRTVGLDFDGSASGGAVATAAETIQDLDASNNQYQLAVTAGVGVGDASSDSVDLVPNSRRLHVIKDINVSVNSLNPNSFASISFVDNTFTQGGVGPTPPIPEPMSLALLPLALVGLGLKRRWRA